jgi:hypothetical protein
MRLPWRGSLNIERVGVGRGTVWVDDLHFPFAGCGPKNRSHSYRLRVNVRQSIIRLNNGINHVLRVKSHGEVFLEATAPNGEILPVDTTGDRIRMN